MFSLRPEPSPAKSVFAAAGHAQKGSSRMIAVSSAQAVEMLQSVAARWRRLKWLGNGKFQGGHPSNYL